MSDPQFVKESIKMDLYRVVTAAGNINNELPLQSIEAFMRHADMDFEKTQLTDIDKKLRQQLARLLDELPQIKDPHSRLRWAENVLTIRSLLV